MKEIKITSKSDIQIHTLLKSQVFYNIEHKLKHDSLGALIKKPVEKRLADSKFAMLLKDIPTTELKILTIVLGFSGKCRAAISMYLTAENTSIQRYALKLELEKRLSEEQPQAAERKL